MDIIYPKENGELEHLLSHIMTTYLINLYCICVLWKPGHLNEISSITIAASNIYETSSGRSGVNSRDKKLIWLKYDEKYSNNTDELTVLGINAGCQAFIVSSEMVPLFLDSYNSVRFMTEIRYHVMHLVLLKTDMSKREIDAAPNHPVFKDVPNILIIARGISDLLNGNDRVASFDLLTHRFSGPLNGDELYLVDTFFARNNTFKQNANLFPDKINDLQGRVVRVAMFNYKPYTILTEVAPGVGNANAMNSDKEKTLLVDGTDGLMVLEFCYHHNCTVEVSLDEEGEWGVIYNNATGDGIIGSVAERRAELGIGALYSWHHEFLFLDFSAPVTRTGVSCVVPRPRLLGGLILPAMPFSLKMWIGVLISYFGVVASLILTQNSGYRLQPKTVKDGPDCTSTRPVPTYVIFLDIFGVFLSQSSNIPTKWLPDMIIIGCILPIGLMIGNAYGGGLASIMTIPHYEPPIDNVHQLSESNLEWGATHDAWVFSILNATGKDIERVAKNFRAYPIEKLEKRTSTRDFAFSVERLPWGNFAIGSYITEDSMKYLQLMKTDIYYEYCVAMFFKTWSMKSNLDLLILRVAEGGIQRYWELQATLKHTDSKTQLGISKSRHQDNNIIISLRPDHVIGVFFLWTIGVLLSISTFAAELLINRCNRGSNTIITYF